MRSLLLFLLIGMLSPLGAFAGALPPGESKSQLPTVAANFRLFDHLGGSAELQRQFLKPAVVLMAVNGGCTVCKEQMPYFQELAGSFADKNVVFLMLDPTAGIDKDAVAAYTEPLGIKLPVLLDNSQMVAHSLGLTRAGEVLLVDTSDWNIAYRGALRSGDTEYLKDAVAALLAEQAIPATDTEVLGTPITYPDMSAELTYTHDIAPILEERCATCHRKGDIGPFEMSSYAKVKTYAAMMREVTLAKRMPPWHADPNVRHYSNDQALLPQELVKLVTWIDNGAPRGEGEDPLAKYGEEKASEWALGEPDMIVSMSTSRDIPAEGVFPYHEDLVTVNLNGDKWLRAIELLPGNRSVVHHALIFLKFPERLKHIEPEWGGGTGGYFAGYGPGYQTLEFPKGTAKFLPDGAQIEFQMHYTATGKPETDQSRLGLYYYDGEPEKEYITYGASNFAIKIPPRVEDQQFESMYYVRQPLQIWSMAPHMHFRGSRFKYVAEYPDGTQETLLNVPFYDFNWQREYRLPEPKTLPTGTTIRCTAGYNNAETNPNNPDPDDTVSWGNQSWEEMLIGHMSFALAEKTDVNKAPVEYPLSMGETVTKENIVGTEWKWGNYRVFFTDENKALINDSLMTNWSVVGKLLLIDLDDRKMPVNMQDDKLKLLGTHMAYMGRY